MATLIYDRDCPFCRRLADYYLIKNRLGGLQLIDARLDAKIVNDMRRRGYEINDGMILIQGDRILHGAACLAELSGGAMQIARPSRFGALITRRPLIYSMLKLGRRIVLALLGKLPIA